MLRSNVFRALKITNSVIGQSIVIWQKVKSDAHRLNFNTKEKRVKTMKKTIATLIAIAVCIGLTSNAFAADDRKHYTGTFCVERDDTSPEIMYISGAQAKNNTSSSNDWICSVVRDLELDTMDISDWDIVVYRDATTTAAWNITLWSADMTGFSGFGNTVTVPAGQGYHVIDGGRIDSAWAYGVLLIGTNIPAYGRIASYGISEEP